MLDNSDYIQKLVDNFGYSFSDVVYAEQPPPYSELSVSLFPWKHVHKKDYTGKLSITKISRFFFISSIIYCIRSVLATALAIDLAVNSNHPKFYSLWAGNFLLSGGIIMYIAHFYPSDAIYRFRHTSSFILFFHMMVYTLLFINMNNNGTILRRCLYSSYLSCHYDLTTYVQMALNFVVLFAILHDFLNIMMTYALYRKALLMSYISDI